MGEVGQGSQDRCWLFRSGGSYSPTSRHMGAWVVGGSTSSYSGSVYFASSSFACASTEAESLDTGPYLVPANAKV